MTRFTAPGAAGAARAAGRVWAAARPGASATAATTARAALIFVAMPYPTTRIAARIAQNRLRLIASRLATVAAPEDGGGGSARVHYQPSDGSHARLSVLRASLK